MEEKIKNQVKSRELSLEREKTGTSREEGNQTEYVGQGENQRKRKSRESPASRSPRDARVNLKMLRQVEIFHQQNLKLLTRWNYRTINCADGFKGRVLTR